MYNGQVNKVKRAALIVPCALYCLGTAALLADEIRAPVPALASGAVSLMAESSAADTTRDTPYPLMLDNNAALPFDLGGSDTRKLQLQLAQPISLHSTTRAHALDNGSNLLGLDATLDVPVTDHFTVSAGVGQQLGAARFQALGSIQCSNGVLRPDSYTASGCHFVNEPMASTSQQRMDLGAYLDFSHASASVNWFTQDANLDHSAVNRPNRPVGRALLGNGLLSPNLGNPLVTGAAGDPMQYLNSEASGVDLNFKVGIATTNSGDIQLGLAFARVLEANYQGLYATGNEALSWTVAEPFNSAQMNLEWSRGAFSGGVQAFYRDSVDFLNRNSIDSLTTFDVHFTWRAPWNANLTVGASNVMNAGAENATNVENQPTDPLESVYGRIPYVRYKQDL